MHICEVSIEVLDVFLSQGVSGLQAFNFESVKNIHFSKESSENPDVLKMDCHSRTPCDMKS